jgi:hypothetical protein
MNFKILKPKPVQTDWFWFSLVFIVQKPVKLKSKSRCPVPSAQCPQTTSKSRFLLFRKTDMPSAHKLQANLDVQCPQITSKSRCPVSTNYKQISISVVQENRSVHKLQANYNIKKKPTRCRDELES